LTVPINLPTVVPKNQTLRPNHYFFSVVDI